MTEEVKLPENTGQLQEKGKYKKSHSGNPNGKPRGARNRATLAAEALLEGSLDKICKESRRRSAERQYASCQDDFREISST